MAKTYYVYRLLDPETRKPFYIGKGTGDRIKSHEREARTGNTCNQAKIDKINSIQNKGNKVTREIVRTFDNEGDAYLYERKLIKKTSGLTNIKENQYKPKVVSLYETISDVFNGYANKTEALSNLNKLSTLANIKEHRKLIKATKNYINNNNLVTECGGSHA